MEELLLDGTSASHRLPMQPMTVPEPTDPEISRPGCCCTLAIGQCLREHHSTVHAPDSLDLVTITECGFDCSKHLEAVSFRNRLRTVLSRAHM